MKRKRVERNEWEIDGEIIVYGPEPAEWNIISAMDRVNCLAEHTRLCDEFWQRAEHPIAFLTEKLELTKMQVVLMAIICETGGTMGWKGIADYLNVSRLSVMGYADEMNSLVQRGWLHLEEVRGFRENGPGYCLEEKALKAFSQNNTYVPINYAGLSMQEFMDVLMNYISRLRRRSRCSCEEHLNWMEKLVEKNPQLPLCAMLSDCDINNKAVFLLLAADYAKWGNAEEDGEDISRIMNFFAEEEPDLLEMELTNGSHIFFGMGYIEHYCDNGLARTDRICLTEKAKLDFFTDYSFSKENTRRGMNKDRDIRECKDIVEKALYYNHKEEQQIKHLSELLTDEKMREVCQRLEEEGMRKGFACLFYGTPGTGKTETVLQLARMTGRDVMQIDISSIRDKYVGESEKNLKDVFIRYKKACKNAEKMPILLFNEADAIFSKRFEKVERSVDSMYNALQNILLQEMEDLQGILIATTNLTKNLDNAFERRFLFKVEFHKPEAEVKAKIWCSMMKDLTEEDAITLANKFDFSGGQIENIARKSSIQYILTGKRPTLEELLPLCNEELLDIRSERTRVGFLA